MAISFAPALTTSNLTFLARYLGSGEQLFYSLGQLTLQGFNPPRASAAVSPFWLLRPSQAWQSRQESTALNPSGALYGGTFPGLAEAKLCPVCTQPSVPNSARSPGYEADRQAGGVPYTPRQPRVQLGENGPGTLVQRKEKLQIQKQRGP